MEHRLADVGTSCVPGGDKPTWLDQPSIVRPIPQRRRSTYGHTHLCPDVAPTLGYHSQHVAEHRQHTPHTPKTVSGHTLRVSCQAGVPPHPGREPPPPKHTTPTHADAPHYPPPHPSSKRLEKMFSLQPSHYQCTVHPPITSNVGIIASIISSVFFSFIEIL